MHSVQQLTRGLRSVEERRVLRTPRVELYTLPAAREVLLEERQRVLQFAAAKHVGVQVPTPVRIRSENAAAENPLKGRERLEVTSVDLELELWLMPITSKGAFSDD